MVLEAEVTRLTGELHLAQVSLNRGMKDPKQRLRTSTTELGLDAFRGARPKQRGQVGLPLISANGSKAPGTFERELFRGARPKQRGQVPVPPLIQIPSKQKPDPSQSLYPYRTGSSGPPMLTPIWDVYTPIATPEIEQSKLGRMAQPRPRSQVTTAPITSSPVDSASQNSSSRARVEQFPALPRPRPSAELFAQQGQAPVAPLTLSSELASVQAPVPQIIQVVQPPSLPKLKTFTGLPPVDPNEATFDDWIEQVRHLTDLTVTPEVEKEVDRRVLSSLRGFARTEAKKERITKATELLALMKRLFGRTKGNLELAQEFTRLVWKKGEIPAQYLVRLQTGKDRMMQDSQNPILDDVLAIYPHFLAQIKALNPLLAVEIKSTLGDPKFATPTTAQILQCLNCLEEGSRTEDHSNKGVARAYLPAQETPQRQIPKGSTRSATTGANVNFTPAWTAPVQYSGQPPSWIQEFSQTQGQLSQTQAKLLDVLQTLEKRQVTDQAKLMDAVQALGRRQVADHNKLSGLSPGGSLQPTLRSAVPDTELSRTTQASTPFVPRRPVKCYNCDQDHLAKDCPQPRDSDRIKAAFQRRKQYLQGLSSSTASIPPQQENSTDPWCRGDPRANKN